MNEKNLFNAIGNIDEKFIYESEKAKSKINYFSLTKKIIGSAVAALVLIAGISIGVPSIDKKGDITIRNDIGVVVKAEYSLNGKTKDTELIQDKCVTIPDTDFKKMAVESEKNPSTNFKEIADMLINNPSSISVSEINNKDYSIESIFTKQKDGDLYEWKGSCSLPMTGDIYFNQSATQTFKISGKGIKQVDVSSKNSFCMVKEEKGEEVSFQWVPFKDFIEYYLDKEKIEKDFSILKGDTLSIKITFENGTETTKFIKLSWDKNGSLIANVK